MTFHVIMLPAIFGFLVSLLVALYAWRRHSPGSALFAVVMVAVALWSFSNVIESALPGLKEMVFWASVQYFGIVTVPAASFAFALRYTGRSRWLTRKTIALLAIMPVVTLALVWTNAYHGLIWKAIRLDETGPIPLLDVEHGAGFWVHTAYSYLLLAAALVLLATKVFRSPDLYRRQAVALIAGLVFPIAANAFYLFATTSLPKVDTTPFMFTITGIALGLGFFRYRLLDIVPIARNTVIETMRDAVIVLDAQDRIVDLNDAAVQFAGAPRSNLVGAPVEHAFPGVRPSLETILPGDQGNRSHTELTVEQNGSRRYFNLHVSPLLGNRNAVLGRVMNVYEVTERKETEEALWRSESDNRALLEAIPDVILRLRPDGTLLSLYCPTSYPLPIAKERLEGVNLYDLPKLLSSDTPTEIVENGMIAVRRAVTDKEPQIYEFEVPNDETPLWFEARIVLSQGDEAIAIVRNVTDRKQAQEVRENQILLTEIHHRVKNNLQVVSSLLLLQSRDIEDPEIRQMFDESRNRVRTMALIHEQLYQSDSLKGINLAAYIEELTSTLMGSFGMASQNADLILDVEEVFVDIAKATPCGLIIHEIVSNSLKHAFPDGRMGTIRITLRGGETVHLTIADDGVGFAEQTVSDQPRSIGLTVIDALTNQIDATMEIDRENGTKYTISFPA